MPYYSQKSLEEMGFKLLGRNVKISTRASIYNCDRISIGDSSRIDDFCVVSGKLDIGSFVYFGPFCLVAGGEKGITFEDFSTLAYHVKIFTQSDDYSGHSLTNPTVPDDYKQETKKEIIVKRHSIIGTGSVVFPGVVLSEGTSVGALSLIRKSTQPWSIYTGIPARKIKDRSRKMLEYETALKDKMLSI